MKSLVVIGIACFDGGEWKYQYISHIIDIYIYIFISICIIHMYILCTYALNDIIHYVYTSFLKHLILQIGDFCQYLAKKCKLVTYDSNKPQRF